MSRSSHYDIKHEHRLSFVWQLLGKMCRFVAVAISTLNLNFHFIVWPSTVTRIFIFFFLILTSWKLASIVNQLSVGKLPLTVSPYLVTKRLQGPTTKWWILFNLLFYASSLYRQQRNQIALLTAKLWIGIIETDNCWTLNGLSERLFFLKDQLVSNLPFFSQPNSLYVLHRKRVHTDWLSNYCDSINQLALFRIRLNDSVQCWISLRFSLFRQVESWRVWTGYNKLSLQV